MSGNDGNDDQYRPAGRWVGQLGCLLAFVAALAVVSAWITGDLARANAAFLIIFIGTPVAVLLTIFWLNTRD